MKYPRRTRQKGGELLKVLIATIVATISLMMQPSADDINAPQLMRVTCYTGGTITYSGQAPREGICASNYANMGKVAIIYDSNMNYIGIWECLDVGSNCCLQNGTALDLWMPDLGSCYEFVGTYGDYLYVQFIDAE